MPKHNGNQIKRAMKQAEKERMENKEKHRPLTKAEQRKWWEDEEQIRVSFTDTVICIGIIVKCKLKFHTNLYLKVKMIIYVDLDGVLADFEGMIRKTFHKNPNDISPSQLWKYINYYNKNVGPFFESLEMCEGVLSLWEFLPQILRTCKFSRQRVNLPKTRESKR